MKATIPIAMCGRYELYEMPANLGSRYRIGPGDLVPNADVCPSESVSG